MSLEKTPEQTPPNLRYDMLIHSEELMKWEGWWSNGDVSYGLKGMTMKTLSFRKFMGI